MARIFGIIFSLLFLFFQFQTTSSKPPNFQVWGVFHYYLNSKYFNELGYFDLYACALEADKQGKHVWERITTVRDVTIYKLVLPAKLPPCPFSHFSEKRWHSFRNDIGYFSTLAPLEYFQGVFADKGFNAPPFWVAVTSFIANCIPIDNYLASIIFFNLDVLFILASLAIIWHHSGGKIALSCGMLALFFFGNMRFIGGNYFQYLWFLPLTLAMYYWNRFRPAAAGCWLGISSCLQAFPLIFGLPIIGSAFFCLYKRNRYNKLAVIFTLTFIVSILACVAFGSYNSHGILAWLEWYNKISLHRNYLPGEPFNIGFANLLSLYNNTPTAVMPRTYIDDFPDALIRLEQLKEVKWIIYLQNFITGLIILLWLWRSKGPAFFGLGYLCIFSLISLSAYYYLVLALIPYAFASAPTSIKRIAYIGITPLMLFNFMMFPIIYTTLDYALHLCSMISIALYMWAISAAILYDAIKKNDKIFS